MNSAFIPALLSDNFSSDCFPVPICIGAYAWFLLFLKLLLLPVVIAVDWASLYVFEEDMCLSQTAPHPALISYSYACCDWGGVRDPLSVCEVWCCGARSLVVSLSVQILVHQRGINTLLKLISRRVEKLSFSPFLFCSNLNEGKAYKFGLLHSLWDFRNDWSFVDNFPGQNSLPFEQVIPSRTGSEKQSWGGYLSFAQVRYGQEDRSKEPKRSSAE